MQCESQCDEVLALRPNTSVMSVLGEHVVFCDEVLCVVFCDEDVTMDKNAEPAQHPKS